MSQEKQESDEVLIDTIVSKLEKQDERILSQESETVVLKEGIKQIPDYSKEIQEVKSSLKDYILTLKQLKFPTEKMDGLSKKLTEGVTLLRQPVETKVLHHHYIPQIIWIAAGLFLSLCLVCSGWFITASRLSEYQANDVKYRKIKLEVDSAGLLYLRHLDSLYSADPTGMRGRVEVQERLKQERLELLDRIQTVDRKLQPPVEKAGEEKKGASDRHQSGGRSRGAGE
jgi:hypothetical protein